MNCWFALQTKPHREQAVLNALERAGLETYCPRIRQWRRRAGRKVREECPLFPGYLFVRLLFVRDYPRIRWTPGLVRVVMSGGTPVEITEETLSAVRKIEKVGTGSRLRALALTPGVRVRVTEGPFAGFEGLVAGTLSGGERVRILLELFRRQTALDCDPEWLRPVAAAV